MKSYFSKDDYFALFCLDSVGCSAVGGDRDLARSVELLVFDYLFFWLESWVERPSHDDLVVSAFLWGSC